VTKLIRIPACDRAPLTCSYDGLVKILLPPSEGKTPAASGPTLDLDGLSAPELNPSKRKRVL
jgi:hypothetical protein